MGDHSRDTGVTVGNKFPYCIHVTRLEPRFFDVLGVLVSDDPIELLAISKGVLNQMSVLANPDVDAFFLYELGSQRVASQVGTFEKGSETGIS